MAWASVITGAGWGTGAVQEEVANVRGKLTSTTENERRETAGAVYIIHTCVQITPSLYKCMFNIHSVIKAHMNAQCTYVPTHPHHSN